MSRKTLIKNATVVLPDETIVTSVLLDGPRISAVDAARTTVVDETIDATGLHLLPGVIDDQVHFREPGLTHKEDLSTASRACAKGGVTTFLEMPNTKPETISVERLAQKLELASRKSIVNYGFYIGATPDNITELQAASRTPGIKIFIGSSTGDLLVDEQAALERIFAETTLPITAHCEDESTVRANAAALAGTENVRDHSRIRDERAAIVATRRAIDLAHRHQHRFHVLHVSTAAELPVLADHRNRITAEACPHHLFFNVDDYDRLGTRIQMNPSIKTAHDNQQLWRALLADTIQVIATDHAPHTLEEKDRPYPNSPSGLPAVENSLALLLNQVNLGNCSLQHVAHWMSDAPARVWGIVGKGRIAAGYDADFTVVDMKRRETITNAQAGSRAGWTPYDGKEVAGWPIGTIVRGRRVMWDGDIVTPAQGRPVRFSEAL
ncbi:MAG: dihydroorotase [Planctomycetales bacterium]|nr:dihydroorotase [Planctomycetales bacterium]